MTDRIEEFERAADVTRTKFDGRELVVVDEDDFGAISRRVFTEAPHFGTFRTATGE